jgi:hypothetical protein
VDLQHTEGPQVLQGGQVLRLGWWACWQLQLLQGCQVGEALDGLGIYITLQPHTRQQAQCHLPLCMLLSNGAPPVLAMEVLHNR